jgi:6-phosphogluconolactonase
MKSSTIIYLSEGADFWVPAVERWAVIAQEAVARQGRFRVALSCGRSPLPFYQQLSESSSLKCLWPLTDIFVADERNVPLSHPDSNLSMIQKYLPGPANLSSRFYSVPVNALNVNDSVLRYEQVLRSYPGFDQLVWPVFDVIVLGVGPDGHTASLFPGSEDGSTGRQWVTAATPAAFSHQRISLTMPVLNAAHNVFFIVSGEEKRDVLKRTLAGDPILPAARVQLTNGQIFFFLSPELAGAD